MKRSAADLLASHSDDESQLWDEGHEQPKTVAEAVYWKFRQDILLGKLPPGSPLRSNDLRRDYNIGISPLREALSRLLSEKLVTMQGQRGFRVAPITVDDVIDTMETRIVLEAEALTRSIRSGGLAWETGVVSSFHTLSRTELPKGPGEQAETWAKHHRRFHMALLAGCGSAWMMTLARSLFDHAERHRIIALQGMRERRSAGPEHKKIMEAALEGDAQAAISAIDSHYRSTANFVVESIKAKEAGKAS